MRLTPVLRATALAGLLAVLAACAQGGSTATPSPAPTTSAPELPDAADALVLSVEHTGGFTTPEMLAARLPVVAVYADGRVFTEGPVVAIYPGPAWPNVQLQQIDRDDVRTLAQRALDAGLAEDGDLGSPPVADATSTRFTLQTADGTFVREAYALTEGRDWPDSGLTEDQQEARARLAELRDDLTDLPATLGPEAVGETEQYEPAAVAALVRPYTEPADMPGPPELPWPGPALPGEPLAPGVTCLTAEGEQATAVAAAAREATTLTPWVGADGARWAITFRPLLPHEQGCGDLTA
ncbi:MULTISPECIES: hypothetical protein [unclassified Modestobacter]